MKRWLAVVLLFCLSLCIAACDDGGENGLSGDIAASDGSTGFFVDMIDVNGGDAIVIRTGGKVLMIDAGYDETSDAVVRELKSLGIDAVDCLLITHFDKDHIGGVPGLINSVEVRNVVQPVYEKTDTKTYSRYEAAVKRSGAAVTELTSDTVLTVGGCEFAVYAARSDDYKEADNDFSLVTKVTYGDVSFLFTGDVETERLAEMFRTDVDWSATVLKYPHHGSYNKRSETLIKLVDPDYILIPDGEAKPTSEKLLAFLAERDCTVLKNTSEGTVRLYTDGGSVQVRSLQTDPADTD